MPESKPRKRTARVAPQTSAAEAYKPNPVWFKPVMFGLMIIGLLWIITFYITEGAFPVQSWALVEHRRRIRNRDHRLPDDHALAFLNQARAAHIPDGPVHTVCRPVVVNPRP